MLNDKSFDDDLLLMIDLSFKGYSCAQILLALGLHYCGRENPDLIRAMAGLSHGAGFGQGTCGALTGGCCLLAFYAAKGSDEEEAHEEYLSMRQELVEWFCDTVGSQYGGTDCETIVGDGDNQQLRCGQIVASVFSKVRELLLRNNLSLSEVAHG